MSYPLARSRRDIYIDNIPSMYLNNIGVFIDHISKVSDYDETILQVYETKSIFIEKLLNGSSGWRGEWGLPTDIHHASYNKMVQDASLFWSSFPKIINSTYTTTSTI